MPKKVFRLGERRVISHFQIGKVSRRYLRLEEIARNRGATKLSGGGRPDFKPEPNRKEDGRWR
jgi:hypothetical protein